MVPTTTVPTMLAPPILALVIMAVEAFISGAAAGMAMEAGAPMVAVAHTTAAKSPFVACLKYYRPVKAPRLSKKTGNKRGAFAFKSEAP